MILTRREAVEALGAVVGGAALAGIGRPDGAPMAGPCPAISGRRVRWIVPHAVGGGYDTEARLLQPFLEARLGVRIQVENQPGAGGLAGARAIAAARPDGRTLGLVGVPGLLLARLLERPDAPDPIRDFTVLGRISRSWHVWAAGTGSPLATIDDVLAAAVRRPLVFGLSEAGSTSFISIVSAAALLGVEFALVAGFAGTRSACLAALRGDVDLVCYNYESVRGLIRSGDLQPVLQISDTPIASDVALEGVALLGGDQGIAARRAEARGARAATACREAAALARLVGSGRVIVAPARLPAGLTACLTNAVEETLNDTFLQAVSRRSLDVARAGEATAEVERAVTDAPRFLPAIRAALSRMRG